MRELSIFSAQEISSINEYERFHHTKAYVKSKSELVISKNELLTACGYRNIDKFKKHRMEWDRLLRPVPLSYLSSIGVDMKVITLTIEVDKEEYMKALRVPLYPKAAVVRLMATVYCDIPCPLGTTEEEAIEILKRYSGEKNKRCSINYPELKTVWVDPSGTVEVVYYETIAHVSRKYLIPSGSGGSTGKSYVR